MNDFEINHGWNICICKAHTSAYICMHIFSICMFICLSPELIYIHMYMHAYIIEKSFIKYWVLLRVMHFDIFFSYTIFFFISLFINAGYNSLDWSHVTSVQWESWSEKHWLSKCTMCHHRNSIISCLGRQGFWNTMITSNRINK